MQKKTSPLRLGVNIDHVATIRNARGDKHPDPIRAAILAIEAGADGITAHLREDRRHISDGDIAQLMEHISRPLNLEMAATDEMLKIALHHKPHACCIVPEKRQELTTEGGLDAITHRNILKPYIAQLKNAAIRTSLFIDAQRNQIECAKELGADIIELHTGTYCQAALNQNKAMLEDELARIRDAASYAHELGLEVHAGHGLTFKTVGAIAAIPTIIELNIGHFLIGEAIYTGLHTTIKQMRAQMDQARHTITGAQSA